MGTMYRLFVAAANFPVASSARTAFTEEEDWAAAAADWAAGELLLLLLFLLSLTPTTAPTTTAMMTRRAIGIPNLIHLLVDFPFGFSLLGGEI